MPKIKFSQPGGAFYFFIDIRQLTHDSQTWCEQLLKEGQVALVPGEAFGAPGFVRLSFAASDKTLVDGIKNLREFVMKEAS
ncbi:aminotransferase class I/II-fold pyridoxal phosphate-dependent enzyme [Candidatus Saccharibacteria bacterium]|nr:aminotransferase class I/II-fold pyridoxal phosphate-dependent enzyme [Candidatus Saccharibacteria bacterium]